MKALKEHLTRKAGMLFSLVVLAAPANECTGGPGGTGGTGGSGGAVICGANLPLNQCTGIAQTVAPSAPEVRYGDSEQANHHQLEFDVYPATGGTSGAAPVILFVHGGLAEAADPTPASREVPDTLLGLRDDGWAIVSVSYRTRMAPGPVRDIKQAIKWLRRYKDDTAKNPAAAALDENIIVVAGISGGGHMAAMVGLTDDPANNGTFEPNDLSPALQTALENENSLVDGILVWQGPDLGVVATDAADNSDMAVINCHGNPYLGCRIGGTACPSPCPGSTPTFSQTCTDLLVLGSPVAFVSSNDVPIYLAYGQTDNWISKQSGVRLRDAYIANGLSERVWYDVVSGVTHCSELQGIDMNSLMCFLERTKGKTGATCAAPCAIDRCAQ